jgi:hypothetical protein
MWTQESLDKQYIYSSIKFPNNLKVFLSKNIIYDVLNFSHLGLIPQKCCYYDLTCFRKSFFPITGDHRISNTSFH